MAAHTMFDGRLQIYRRKEGGPWQAAGRVGHQRFRQSTGEQGLDRAKDIAEEWYLDLRGKLRAGVIVKPTPREKLFGEAAALYLAQVKVLAFGTRSKSYVENLELRMNAHVLPFFEDKALSAINKGLVQTYRVKRAEETIEKTTERDERGSVIKPGKAPARSTMLQEIVIIRQVLKHAEGLEWIPSVPNLSTPYMTQGKKGRRAWFSPEEYKRLYEATRKRITKGTRPGWKSHYQDLHDFVLFMANTGLRPDEAWNLEFRDVHIEDDYATKKTILVIDVRGKVGVGYAKSLPNAVHPFEDVRKRREQKLRDEGKSEMEIERLLPTMKVFPEFDRHTFNAILDEENLKFDRDGKRRTAYSLRHTYISMRLMEGANIHQLANNCRTSVQMIEEHYASHIKDRIDAASINIMRPKAARKAARKSRSKQEHAPAAHR